MSMLTEESTILIYIKQFWSHYKETIGGTLALIVSAWLYATGRDILGVGATFTLGMVLFFWAAYCTWLDEHTRASGLEKQLSDIVDAKPNIVVLQWEGGLVNMAMPPAPKRQARFLNIRFCNEPRVGKPSYSASEVLARITFFEVGSNKNLLTIIGRWAESTQPSVLNPYQDQTHLEKADFTVGQERTLNIVYIDPVSGNCSAFNNENYKHAGYSFPDYFLKTNSLRVRIRLLATDVDVTKWVNIEVKDETVNPHRFDVSWKN